MEKLFDKFKLPFTIIIIIAIVFVLIQLSSAYDSYWNGKLTKLKYYQAIYEYEKSTGKAYKDNPLDL